MSLLTAELSVQGDKARQVAHILFDTGASHSFIRRELAEQIATITPLPEPMHFTLGDARTLTITDLATIQIELPGTSGSVLDAMMVIDQGVEEIVLGASTMRKFGLKLDLEHGTVFAELIEQPVPPRKEPRMETGLQTVLTQLGIEPPADMTDEQAIAAIVSAKAAPAQAVISPIVLAALELPATASEAEVTGKIAVLKNPGNTVPAQEYLALKAKEHERDIKEAVATALTDGKLFPHEEAWAITEATRDLPSFRAFAAQRQKVVPYDTVLPTAETTKPEQSTAKPLDVMAIYAARRKAVGG